MSVGYQIKEVLEQIMWMGVAFGIVGYFIYREWGRRRESMTMLERMTPEQLASGSCGSAWRSLEGDWEAILDWK